MTSYAATDAGRDLRRAEAALSAQGLSARQVADQLGIDKRTVQRWLKARREQPMPTPAARPTRWQDQAECLSHSNLFERCEAPVPTLDDVSEAKDVCIVCPVRDICLADALSNETGGKENRAGIFGGKDAAERARYARNQRPKTATPAPRTGGRLPAECGTRAAYERHVRNGEPVDPACEAGYDAYRVARRVTSQRAKAAA